MGRVIQSVKQPGARFGRHSGSGVVWLNERLRYSPRRNLVVAVVGKGRNCDCACWSEIPDRESLPGHLVVLVVELWRGDDQNKSECVLAVEIEAPQTLLADES